MVWESSRKEWNCGIALEQIQQVVHEIQQQQPRFLERIDPFAVPVRVADNVNHLAAGAFRIRR